MNKIKDKITSSINNFNEISPFLFIGDNIELLNQKIYLLASEILEELNIPKTNIFKLEDNGESIKLREIKEFLKITDSITPYKVQIIIIENFARANIQSQNSCLKKFEEPGVKNIYFLSSKTESGILDTILSRVQTIKIDLRTIKNTNNFFYDLLNQAILDNNPKNIISYFFKNKLEKQEYISFLESLIDFIKNNRIFIEYLDAIFEDINMIKSNNVLPKYVTDKWILKIIK